MPAKLTTTINKIKTVPNPTNAEIIYQFYHYMKGTFPQGWHGQETTIGDNLFITMHPGTKDGFIKELFDFTNDTIIPIITLSVFNKGEIEKIVYDTSQGSLHEGESLLVNGLQKECNPLTQNSTSLIDDKMFRTFTIACTTPIVNSSLMR
jgi:hypothetical protein